MDGLCMQSPNSFLDADEIRAATFIRHVEIHDTLSSTNDRAAELARNPDIELPALVAARIQTAGRGRGKNVWHAFDGALTFSILIDSAAHGIGTANWPQLSLATAVAVCDAISPELNSQSKRSLRAAAGNPQSEHLSIKYPNDVLLNGEKVCGILVESPGGERPAKDRLIIGIGINVNNSWRHTKNETTNNRAALCDVTGRSHSLGSLLIRLIDALNERMRQLSRNDRQLLGILEILVAPIG